MVTKIGFGTAEEVSIHVCQEFGTQTIETEVRADNCGPFPDALHGRDAAGGAGALGRVV